MKCQFCSKICKNDNSLRNHQRLCKFNPNRQISSIEKYNFLPEDKKNPIKRWNKGLTKYTDSRILEISEKMTGKPFKGGHTEEGLKKLSDHAKRRNLGGYRPHPNKGCNYKGIWFDSKWELRLAESLDLNNIRWERPKNGFVWNDTGNKYFPDFFLIDYNVYLDPKNSYLQIKDKQKIENASLINNIKIFVLNESQLDWKIIKNMLL